MAAATTELKSGFPFNVPTGLKQLSENYDPDEMDDAVLIFLATKGSRFWQEAISSAGAWFWDSLRTSVAETYPSWRARFQAKLEALGNGKITYEKDAHSRHCLPIAEWHMIDDPAVEHLQLVKARKRLDD